MASKPFFVPARSINAPAGTCPSIIPRLNATAAYPYCVLLQVNVSRSSGASTEKIWRSRRLIAIDVESNPTIVQRVFEESVESAVDTIVSPLSRATCNVLCAACLHVQRATCYVLRAFTCYVLRAVHCLVWAERCSMSSTL